MANKPTHRLAMRDTYTQNGEKKTKWTNIMPLRENDKGQLIINLPKGMLLSGTLYIFENKQDDTKNNTPEDGLNSDEELPF